jgi:hypothetical protein
MGDLEHSYTFEDGENAGDLLLSLIKEINPDAQTACDAFTPDHELQKIYAALWQRSEYKRPLRCVEGFLSRVLKPTDLDGSIITLWGADKLFENQKEWAPICEIPPESGIVQLGYWTGESDGDGWCLDIDWRCIRCIYVSSGSSDLDQVRLASYGVFKSLWQWIAYLLRCSAWERGWVKRM